MLLCIFDRARKACAQRKLSSSFASFAFMLFMAAGISSCGGGHSPLTSANSGNPSAGSTSALNISASLPAASVGAGYSGSVSASGGSAPYTFSIAWGQLPDGVQLAQNSGAISGTPNSSGNFSFSISVTDSSGQSQQKALQISVANNSSSGGSGSSSGSAGSGGSGSGSGGSSGGSGGSGSAGGSGGSGGSGSGGSGGTSGGGSGGGSGGNAAKTFSNVQRAGGWGQFGQGPPNFVDCSPSPCDGISFSMTQDVNNPSMSGNATIFNVGGNAPYSDALFNNHLIGPLSSQGTFDENGSLVPSISNFTYDVYFYGDNLDSSEALEFDINQFFGGMGFIFGHECRIAAGNEWDVWDNANGKWIHTGVPCHPNSNSWNHVILQVHRTSDNHLTYQSITLNGQTTTLNWSFEHGSAENWYGVTVNFQMDGNSKQDSYNVYLDNLTVSYQ